MGCAQSKIDNEESVARCKDRRNFMKDAVAARNAFAAAHSGYAVALKSTGAALSDYARGEAETTNSEDHLPHSVGSSTPLPQMMETTLPPPPPPLPSFSPITPLQRSVTMPEFSVTKNMKKMKSVTIAEDEDEESDDVNDDLDLRKHRNRADGPSRPKSSMRTPEPPPPPELKGMAWDYFFMVDNMEDNEENEEDEYEERFNGMKNVGKKILDPEPKTPERVAEVMDTEEEVTPVMMEKQFLHSKTAPPDIRIEMGKDGKIGPSVNMLKILGDIDDHFLKASEAAQEVSKMLEATRMHYHSNFADNRGYIDHAARVMQVITWNRSFGGAPGTGGLNNDFDAEEYETHATVLDKLLAWEKKLYEEVKAGELIKLEYQRKVAVLGKLKKRSASFESVEKTKAAVTHLHTKYIVDMQSLDSTVLEVNHIRDDQLYPKLVALVNGMSQMWESLCMHHDNQLTIVTDLKALEISGAPKETTKHHHDRTVQLFNVIQEWHSQFEKLVSNQKQYIQALNSWLKLNLIPIESSLREKVSSPPRTQNPLIQPLVLTWHDYLEKLPDELAKSAIISFGAAIKTIILHQEEEMKLKEKSEETRKEYFRKSQAFDDWYQKYMPKRAPNDDSDPNRGEGTNTKDPISERQFVVESLKKRLEEEMEAHQKHCVQVRDKSLQSLKIRLPELFRALSDYSHACVDTYKRLSSVAHLQNVNGNSHTS